MGAQRASAKGPSADVPDGFGVAVVREEGKWQLFCDGAQVADESERRRDGAA